MQLYSEAAEDEFGAPPMQPQPYAALRTQAALRTPHTHPKRYPTHPGAPPTELRGWRSNHLPPGGPLAWSTAQAVRCLARVHLLTRALINADVLASLGGRGAARPAAAPWDRLLDSDLVSDGTTLKRVLDQRMLTPLAALAAADPGGADSYSALLAATSYSGILFGPPGTAK